MDLDEGTTVENLFADLDIPSDSPKITFVNGVHAEPDRVLEEGDRVAVFPPIAGG
jgi:sulfur carrier protein ThiS